MGRNSLESVPPERLISSPMASRSSAVLLLMSAPASSNILYSPVSLRVRFLPPICTLMPGAPPTALSYSPMNLPNSAPLSRPNMVPLWNCPLARMILMAW